MSLKFGTNSLLIKKYSAKELNIISENEQDFEIELQQKYFHFLYIPFFPLEKIWCTRKNNELYNLPIHYVQTIVSKNITAATPWYTYAGPIIVLFFAVLFGISSAINASKQKKDAINYYNGKNEALKNRIKGLNNKDFIKLKKTDTDDKFIEFLKVQKVEGKKIYVSIIKYDNSDYWSVSDMKIEKYYETIKNTLDTIIINADDLLKAGFDENAYTENVTHKDLIINNTNYYYEEIIRHNGVIIKEKGTGGYGAGDIGLYFYSNGLDFEITAITNIENTIKWLDVLPCRIDKKSISYDNAFYIKGMNYKEGTAYKFKITTKDSIGEIHNYLIDGYNCTNNVTPLD